MLEEDTYNAPSIEDVGVTEPMGIVGLALAVLIAAAVYDGVVLVNYGVVVNIGGGLNFALKVNAITK